MFDNVNGARLAAKRLQQAHALKLSTAREIVAIAAGYRDNHHLERLVGRPDAPSTPTRPAAAFVTLLRTIAPDLDPEETMAVIMPTTITDAGSLADRHPLTRGYGDFVRAAQAFSGGPFEMWLDEDGVDMEVSRRMIGRDGRREVSRFCSRVEECLRSIFGANGDTDGLYDRYVVMLDDDALTVEQHPSPLGPNGMRQYPGRRVRMPYAGSVVSEIMLTGTKGMPVDTASLNVWRNVHHPHDFDVLDVVSVRDDGTHTFYEVSHDDVARMSLPMREEFGDVDTGGGSIPVPQLPDLSIAPPHHRSRSRLMLVLPESEDADAATRHDVQRAARHFATMGLEVPDSLADAWLVYPDALSNPAYRRSLVSIRDMGKPLTDLEAGTGRHGITVIIDPDCTDPAVLWIGPDGRWRTPAGIHGTGSAGMEEALATIQVGWSGRSI